MSSGRRRHPHRAHTLRWAVATVRLSRLVAGLVAGLIAVSALLTLAYILLEGPQDDKVPYAGAPHRWLLVGLATVRAVLGIAELPRQPNNVGHEALASLVALVGAAVPALALGILLIRLFSSRAFAWREQINICSLAEIDESMRSALGYPGNHSIIAVRWYKRSRYLSVYDLRCRAFVRFELLSEVDKTSVTYSRPLALIDVDGAECTERCWPRSTVGTPFTAWIPVRAPVIGKEVSELQGIDLRGASDVRLVVQLQGQTQGMSSDLYDEMEYRLNDDDVQLGRFAGVHPDESARIADWKGWDRYDQSIDQAVFVYGSILADSALGELYEREVEYGKDYVRATLTGYVREWGVGTDNRNTEARVRYLDANDPDIQPDVCVLFLDVSSTGAETDRVAGLLLRVDGQILARLDAREGNYRRHVVTDRVEQADPNLDADVIWTYTGDRRPRDDAAAAIADGRAVVRLDYWGAVEQGMIDQFGREQASVHLPAVPDRVELVPLLRVERQPVDDQ